MRRALHRQGLLAALGLALAGAGMAAAPAVQAAASSAAALPAPLRSIEGISEYRLPNGLQVLLAPDDSKPTTTVNVTYRVGSRHEGYGETGMAHLLEHLMFKGSPRHPLVWGEFNKRGLAANGSTGFDRTNYFASFAASEDNLDWYLGWQADAMVNSFIARRDLDSEMTVVRNEMESGENNPMTVLWQRVLGQMFQWHNYGKVTIGARSDVENVDIGRLQAFYRLYYQPDNATLIVSGKFDVARTLRTIARQFGAIARPRRDCALPPQGRAQSARDWLADSARRSVSCLPLPRLYTLDPVQDGERSFTLRRAGGTPSLLAGYHVPSVADPQYAAAEVLSSILGDDTSGRLQRRLVQKQLAASVFGWAWDLADPGVLMVGAQLAPGQDPEAARAELLATVESFAAEPVTADELARAKAKWLNDWNLRFADSQKVGVALSDAVGQGDWRLFFLLRDRVEALTVDEVQAFAAARLLASNRTLGQYVPTDQPQRAPVPARVDVAREVETLKPRAAQAAVAAFDATPAAIDAATQRFSIDTGAGPGLRVAVLPKPTRGGAVRATLLLDYGDVPSLQGQGARAELLAAMFDKGAATLSRQQVQDRLDALQSQLSFSGAAGEFSVTITSRRESLAAVIELAAALLRDPALRPEDLEEVRRQSLASLAEQRQEPEAVAANVLERHANAYPAGDPRYARSFDEVRADLEAVTPEALREFHRRFLGASFAQLGVAGDVDVPALRAALESAFGGWRSASPYVRVPQPLRPVAAARLVTRTPDKQNAVMMVAQALPLNDEHPDYAAFTLVNWLLGGGSGDSRLWKRIREAEGLSYGIGSSVSWSNHEPNSTWTVWGIFAPQNRARIETAFDEIVATALKDGFTEAELRSGVKGLLAFRRLSRAQDARLAGALAANLRLERSFALAQKVDDQIAALTLAQVNAALRRYLDPGQFVRSLAGDFK